MFEPTSKPISIFSLLLLASFASFCAVLLTPALPAIAGYFHVSAARADAVITVYLLGYAAGQLFYGPLANHFGRKKALVTGILITLAATLLSAIACLFNNFDLFVMTRFLMGIGASSGLVISMVIIKDTQDANSARHTFAKVITAFAFVPFIAIALGGSITHYSSWPSALALIFIYSIYLFFAVRRLPETLSPAQHRKISIPYLLKSYFHLLQNLPFLKLVLLFTLAGSSSYIFNTLAPVIAIKNLHISPEFYGWLSIIPSLGIFFGAWLAARLAHKIKAAQMMIYGAALMLIGGGLLMVLFGFNYINLPGVYAAATLIFCGASIINPNASMQALTKVSDHANATSVMNATVLFLSSLLVGIPGRFIETSVNALPLALLAVGSCSVILAVLPEHRKEEKGSLVTH